MSYDTLTINTDGACSGNPGPAGIGVVIVDGDKVVKMVSRYIGQATNNIAEYTALVVALEEALVLGGKKLVVRTDSELMYKQIIGQYAVKHDNIKPLYEKAKALITKFDQVDLSHVRREFNKEADKLSTQAIKNFKQDDRPAVADGGEESPSSKE